MTLKIFYFLLLILFSFQSTAQVKFAAFAGPQATKARYMVRDIRQPAEFKYGIMAGLGLKAPFENNLYFFPSIYYSLKGYRVTLNDRAFPPTELAMNNNTTIHSIEIAPLFQIDLSKKDGHPFIRIGPAVDFIFSGTEKFDTLSTTGVVGSLKRPMLFDFTVYGRITASANVHLGYENRKGWMVFAHYAHGLGSMNNGDNGPRILHRVLGISAGWYFGRAGD